MISLRKYGDRSVISVSRKRVASHHGLDGKNTDVASAMESLNAMLLILYGSEEDYQDGLDMNPAETQYKLDAPRMNLRGGASPTT